MAVPLTEHDSLAAILECQAGVVARRQLTARDRPAVRRHLRVGRWQAPLSTVVVAHNADLTPLQRQWVAVLSPRRRVALGGATAAIAGGLRGWPDDRVHLLAPHGSYLPNLKYVVAHRTRHWDEESLHPALVPPRARIPTALVQMAAWVGSDRSGCAALAAGVQQGLVVPPQLRWALLRQPDVGRRDVLLLTIGDLEGGAQALAEIDAVRLCRQAGLPVPSRQRVRRDGRGRRRYLDLDWDDWQLTAEIDGMQHMEVVQWDADLDRQNEIVIPGDRAVLRFTSIRVRTDPGRVCDQLKRGLYARGWRP